MQKLLNSVVPVSARPQRERASDTLGAETYAASLGLKRGFDIAAVLTMLVLFFPFLITICLLLLVLQGRPIFIRHNRIGKGGKLFPCLKFRTMSLNGDEILRRHLATNGEARAEWETTRKLKVDPRVTPLGHVLRKSSADELPQLFNVLRGEMSLVGPRPIVLDEAKYYGASIQQYHRVRPGLTGSWQIGGRSDVSYPRRVQMDVDYVSNWSFSKDIHILAMTVPAVLKSKGSY